LWGDFLSDTAGPAKCEVDIEAKDDVDIWGNEHAEEKVDTELPVPIGPAGVGDLWADMADRDPTAVPDYFDEEIPENAGDQEVVLDYDFQAAIEEDEFEDLEQPEVQQIVEAADAAGYQQEEEPQDDGGELPNLATDMMADLAEGAADAQLMPPPPPLKRKGRPGAAPACKVPRCDSDEVPNLAEGVGAKEVVQTSSQQQEDEDDDDDSDPMMAQFKALKEARDKGMGRVSLQAVGCGDDSDESSD